MKGVSKPSLGINHLTKTVLPSSKNMVVFYSLAVVILVSKTDKIPSSGGVRPKKEVMHHERIVLGHITGGISENGNSSSNFRMKLMMKYGRLRVFVIFEICVVDA